MIPAATIHGVGAVTPIGRDLNEISHKLATDPGSTPGLFRVSDEPLVEPTIARSSPRRPIRKNGHHCRAGCLEAR